MQQYVQREDYERAISIAASIAGKQVKCSEKATRSQWFERTAAAQLYASAADMDIKYSTPTDTVKRAAAVKYLTLSTDLYQLISKTSPDVSERRQCQTEITINADKLAEIKQ